MKKYGLFALLFASAVACAQPAAQATPVVEHYDYSKNLDIAKVISMEDIPNVCKVVPAHMTYEDHQGQRHVLEYQVMGKGCYE